MRFTLSRRYQYQIGLGILLGFASVSAVACGLLAAEQRRLARQRQAVRAIDNVTFDYQLDSSGSRIPHAAAPGPWWLQKLLGDDVFTHVVKAIILDDTGMKHLDDLPDLRNLKVSGEVTDAGMANLAYLSRLTWLSINSRYVTDAGLVHVARFTTLENLDLGGAPITDRGLIHLRSLTRLEALNLPETQVRGPGLRDLRKLGKLRALWIEAGTLDGRSLKEFQEALPECQINPREYPGWNFF